MNIFGGMEILCIFFSDDHKIGLVFGVISMYLWVFSMVKIQNGDLGGGVANLFFFWGGGWGVLDISDIFFLAGVGAGKQEMLGPSVRVKIK